MLSLLRHPRLIASLRNTAAALAALALAISLGIENPYWAAMTALIVIQPTRGLLFEKSFYRLVGTAIGSGAGLLLLLHTRSPILLTIALALWVALCVGVGNLLYGLRAYALLMAACTCPIIAMSGYQNLPHIYGIAFGRIAGIVVGIIVATGVTALFTPGQSEDELLDRLRRTIGNAVAWLALLLRQGRKAESVRLERLILIEIAEIENLLDTVTAGSFQVKKQARHVRSVLASLLSLLATGRLAGEQLARHDDRDHHHGYWRDLLARQLAEVASRLATAAEPSGTAEMESIAVQASAHLPLLGETLTELVGSLRLLLADYGAMAAPLAQQPLNRLISHRDRREAARAGLRALLTLGAVGLTWSLSGWTKGPLMIMASSIMLSIFSNKEHPASFVGQIFFGAAIGSTTAVFCRIVLLPGVADPFLTELIIAPFILAGVFAMTQRRLAIAATDATLFFIFVVQPGVSVNVVPVDLALGAVAMLMGVGTAWSAYRFLIPINPIIRQQSILAALLRDMETLAAEQSPVPTGRVWARLHHRLIRLVVMATSHDANHLRVVEGGLAALAIARNIRHLREALASGHLPPEAAEIIRSMLQTLTNFTSCPERTTQTLEQAAHSLYELLEPEAGAASTLSRSTANALLDAAGLYSSIAQFWGVLPSNSMR